MAKKKQNKQYAKYYKTKDGKGWLGFKPPVSDEELEAKYLPVSEQEWQAHLNEINQRREPTAEELAAREKKKTIANLKKFLNDTDWVIVKIAEQTSASEIESLRNKYANVILERKNAREQINTLEEE